MADILPVHDHRRGVQKPVATGGRVQSVAERRDEDRQFRRLDSFSSSSPHSGVGSPSWGSGRPFAAVETVFFSSLSVSLSVSDPYVPMFYYVRRENVDFEKTDPGSQPRSPWPECDDAAATDPPLFLWNQALFVIAQLLTSNLLHINELDPIRRYLPSYNRPKRPGRYSAFQVKRRREHDDCV